MMMYYVILMLIFMFIIYVETRSRGSIQVGRQRTKRIKFRCKYNGDDYIIIWKDTQDTTTS